jgi:pyrroline-5-carboxylate reductase
MWIIVIEFSYVKHFYMEILMIGCGAMGCALYGNWQGHHNLRVIDPSKPECLNSIHDLPHSYEPEVIIIAVKPQIMGEVLPLYTARFQNPTAAWVSIAAGITVETLKTRIHSPHIIRAMPNLPALYGQGMTALYSPTGEETSITALFTICGKTCWLLDENLMDAATAISGSGPAYVYAFTQALEKAALDLGLPTDLATLLARQTVVGAGSMLAHSPLDAQTLQQAVTSPGGTTQAGLEVLMPELNDLITKTTKAAWKRSRELG